MWDDSNPGYLSVYLWFFKCLAQLHHSKDVRTFCSHVLADTPDFLIPFTCGVHLGLANRWTRAGMKDSPDFPLAIYITSSFRVCSLLFHFFFAFSSYCCNASEKISSLLQLLVSSNCGHHLFIFVTPQVTNYQFVSYLHFHWIPMVTSLNFLEHFHLLGGGCLRWLNLLHILHQWTKCVHKFSLNFIDYILWQFWNGVI